MSEPKERDKVIQREKRQKERKNNNKCPYLRNPATNAGESSAVFRKRKDGKFSAKS